MNEGLRDFFRNLDGFKIVILISLACVLGFTVWGYLLYDRVAAAETAVTSADSEIKRIASVQQQILDMQQQERDSGSATYSNLAPQIYMDRILTEYGMITDKNLYNVIEDREHSVSKLPAVDKEFEVQFRQQSGNRVEPVYVPRDNLFAIIFNAEARAPQTKLRSLHMRAKEFDTRGRGLKTYPESLSDEWRVDRLRFASRSPRRR